MPVRQLLPAKPGADAFGAAALKASAARIAARIGEDILPMRAPGPDRKITK